MTHRRSFLKQVTATAAATSIGSILAARRSYAARLSGLAILESDPASHRALRERYMLDPEVIYFNHGSIGTIPRMVHEAQVEYLRVCEANPWLYMWGGEWEAPRERVRSLAARLLACSPTELGLTHNTTEGFNTLANGLALGPGDEVVFSSLNHPGASICWFHAAQTKGFTVTQFDFPVSDIPNMTVADVLEVYDRHISPDTRVVVLPHIDNIVGLHHPVREISELAHGRGVELVAVDGAQSVGMIPVDLAALNVDVYCASPHKWLQSPKGVGLMYVREGVQRSVRPMWVTWGQERWRGTARIYEDYGTRNLPEVLALGDAIEFQLRLGNEAKVVRYRQIWQGFRDMTENSTRVIWRSPVDWALSASLFALEIRDEQSSRVFDRMYRDHGFVFRPFRTQGLNTVRISPNIVNTDDEIARFFEVVETL